MCDSSCSDKHCGQAFANPSKLGFVYMEDWKRYKKLMHCNKEKYKSHVQGKVKRNLVIFTVTSQERKL